jgi:hypothetical protein
MPDSALKPGMLVMVQLAMEPRAFAIHSRASARARGAKGLRLLPSEADKAKRIEVKTGRRKPGYVEIDERS